MSNIEKFTSDLLLYNIGLVLLMAYFHLQMASLVAKSLKKENLSPYASNWLERLRQIKNIRTKVKILNNNE